MAHLPYLDPWRTNGAAQRLDAMERAIRAIRKGNTDEERRSGLALIRELADSIERHLERFGPTGLPKSPPR